MMGILILEPEKYAYLMLSMLGKKSADNILKFCFICSRKKVKETICMKCLRLFLGDNLSEKSKPVFWKKIRKKVSSSADFCPEGSKG